MLRRIRRRRGESGFTLLEVVVAMFVFAVLAAASLALVTRTAQTANNNIRRTTAANLATRTIEAVRGQTLAQLGDGAAAPVYARADGTVITDGSTGGALFTISQTSTFVPNNGAATICSDTSNTLAYKRITVQVTWPGMGSTQPVRADTLRAIGVGKDGLDQTKGSLAVQAYTAAGEPAAGVTVTLSPGGTSQTTGVDGCVIFTGLTPGSYTATGTQSGWVSTINTPTAVKIGLGVTATTIGRGQIYIDKGRSVNLAFDTAVANAIAPSGLTTTYSQKFISGTTVMPNCATTPDIGCAVAVPGVLKNFYPEIYTFKVGTCAEPTTAVSAVDANLGPASSEGTTVSVPMGTIVVDVRNATGQSLIGRTVTFQHSIQLLTGCLAGETLTAVTTTPGGTPVAVPYGSWTVSTGGVVAPILGALLSFLAPPLTPANRSTTVVLTVAS